MNENYTSDGTQENADLAQHKVPPVQFNPTPGLCAWLEKMNASLAFTSTQVNKFVIVGQQEERLKIFTRTIENCRAIFARDDRLYVTAGHAVWTYVDVTAGGQISQGHDGMYSPRQSQVTGPVDIHDIYVPKDPARSPVFANTQFSCVAEIDETYNFQPLWTPPFVSALLPEDRCHLTGVAIDPDTEQPRYVTVAAQTDSYEAWRLQRAAGGRVLDVETGQVVLDGLSLPHAPRLYQGSLYVLDSGGGRFGRVVIENNSFEEICSFPGLVKGLSFIGKYAIVTVSSFVHEESVADLPFFERIKNTDEQPQCAVHVVDLETKKSVHALYITGALKEIDSVTIVKGRQNPAILRPESDALSRLYYLPKSFAGKPEHIALDPPARRSLKSLEEDFLIEDHSDYSIVNVFHNVTPEIREALIEFWLVNRALPRQEDPHIRTSQACLLALTPKGEIISEITVYEGSLSAVLPEHLVQNSEEAKDKLYFIRTLTAPGYSHLNLAAKMVLHTYDVLKNISGAQTSVSSDGPKGIAIITENEKLTHPLILKRFKRLGFEVLPTKTHKGCMIIRRMF